MNWRYSTQDYAEAMRRRYQALEGQRADEVRRAEYDALAQAQVRFYEGVVPAECVAHESAVAEEVPACVLDPIDEIERGLFAHDADEPERLRRVFATWDFRNGT